MKLARESRLPWYAEAFVLLTDKFRLQLWQAGTVLTSQLTHEVEELARTRLSGLAPKSEDSYRKAWNRWAAYAMSRGMCALPVTEVGVLAWLRNDLCYTVRAKYFQPYLSALNKAHEHCELAPVAVGGAVADSRRSIAAQQKAVFEAETRVRMPVEHVSAILDAALELEVSAADGWSVQLLRASIAVCVDASCGSRGNTGVHIRPGDVQLVSRGGVPDGHVIRLRALKGQVLVDELSGDEKVLIFPQGAVAGLAQLIQKWDDCREELGVVAGGKFAGKPRDSWYRLPGEARTWSWDVGQMNKFMTECLLSLEIVAPATFKYSWHSLRHMAASSQSAIGVSDARIMHLQNWSSMKVALATYIDPLCPVTEGCYRWYGWMLPLSREAVRTQAAVASTAMEAGVAPAAQPVRQTCVACGGTWVCTKTPPERHDLCKRCANMRRCGA